MPVKGKAGPRPRAAKAKAAIGNGVKVNAPKQKRLAGMEDNKIQDLHDAAKEYASIRDRRMALTQQEVVLNAEVLDLMKKNEKKKYNCEGIEINVVHEKEKVKVRVPKEE